MHGCIRASTGTVMTFAGCYKDFFRLHRRLYKLFLMRACRVSEECLQGFATGCGLCVAMKLRDWDLRFRVQGLRL